MGSWFETALWRLLTMRVLLLPRPEEHRDSDASRRTAKESQNYLFSSFGFFGCGGRFSAGAGRFGNPP